MRNLDFDPLLGCGEVLSSLVGSLVSNFCVAAHTLSRLVSNVAVRHGNVSAGVNLGQASIGNGRVGPGRLDALSAGIELRLGDSILEQRGGVSSRQGLDISDCETLARGHGVGKNGRRTSGLQRVTGHALGCVLSALVQLQHRVNSCLISRINAQQHSLQSQVLVLLRISCLGTSVSGKSQELRQHQETIMQRVLRLLLRLVLNLGDGIRLLFLVFVRQSLLHLGLDRVGLCAVLVVDLLVLGQLLLQLGALGKQSILVKNLFLLVGVDDLGSNQLVEALVLVLGDQRVGLGSIGLGGMIVSLVGMSQKLGGVKGAYDLLVDVSDVPANGGSAMKFIIVSDWRRAGLLLDLTDVRAVRSIVLVVVITRGRRSLLGSRSRSRRLGSLGLGGCRLLLLRRLGLSQRGWVRVLNSGSHCKS